MSAPPRLLLVVALVLAGCGVRAGAAELTASTPPPAPTIEPTATATARPSPSAAPTAAPTPTPAPLAAGEGEVAGWVVYHHGAIQQRRIPDQEVVARRGGKEIARTRSDASGWYSFVLPAGDYELSTRFTVRVMGDPVTRVKIRVTAGQRALVHLSASDGTRCLPGSARIATPSGPVAVRDLALGSLVRTRDGRAVPVFALTSSRVGAGAQAVRIVLDDGRALVVSPYHPLADGRLAGVVAAGDRVDGAGVALVERVPHPDARTWDLAVEGAYVAEGIAVGSTLTPSRGPE